VAILSAARTSRHSILSEKLYDRMKSLFPNQIDRLKSGSILVENIYSALGDHEQAKSMRSYRYKHYGHKAKPGLSWTEKDGEIVVKLFLQSLNI
jgi:hypothetical protein